MVGQGKTIPDKDAEEIGLPARRYLAARDSFVVLVDDLEHHRAPQAEKVFRRYRDALDTMLLARKHRASVHFFVNMLEAYYFADAAAVNGVLGTRLADYDGDVETIRHPKGDLKSLVPGFDEVRDGEKIVRRLDVPHVLSDSTTCASLRTLFAWCSMAIGLDRHEMYCLERGTYNPITREQIEHL